MIQRGFSLSKDILAPVLLSFVVFFTGLALSVGAYSVARNYETQLFPVVENFEITNPRIVGNHLRFNPKFTKLRDCEFVEKSWYVRLDSGELRQVYIGFPDRDNTQNQSAPVGPQVRSDFEVGQGEWPTAVTQHGFVFHDCWGYKVRTKVGPFPIYK